MLQEHAMSTYCSPNDEVIGVNMNTCLGDMYSCNVL